MTCSSSRVLHTNLVDPSHSVLGGKQNFPPPPKKFWAANGISEKFAVCLHLGGGGGQIPQLPGQERFLVGIEMSGNCWVGLLWEVGGGGVPTPNATASMMLSVS